MKQWNRWMMVLTMSALVCLATGVGAQAVPASPMETVKKPIDRIVLILNDPTYKTDDRSLRAEQHDKIWQEAMHLFDFTEVSKRTVGRAWKKFTPAERSRFVDVFAKFLGNTYIDKMQGEYNNEKIEYVKEMVRGNKALVKTNLMRETVSIPIDYRLKIIDGQWRVYDVLVEQGVSLVKNYRVQFRSILQKETPAQLIEKLEEKLAQQRKDRENAQ